MSMPTVTANATKKNTKDMSKEEMTTELKEASAQLGKTALWVLLRTGAIHTTGRVIFPKVFSSFGRTYAFVLLVDLLKARRIVPAAKTEKKI